MLSKNFNFIKKSKFIRKFSIAILSFFAISSPPAEAKQFSSVKQHHKAIRKAPVKATRVGKKVSIKSARVGRKAPVKTARVGRKAPIKAVPTQIVRNPARVTPKVKTTPAQQARQQQVRQAAAQAEQARLQQARQVAAAQAEQARLQQARQVAAAQAEQARLQQARQVAAAQAEQARLQQARQVAAAQAEQARQAELLFQAHNFDAHKVIVPRGTQDSRDLALPINFVNFTVVDVGYGLNLARTAQYGIGMPAAPVIHPYHMDQDVKGYGTASFLLNAKLPLYNPYFGPEALHRNLRDIIPANIESFLIVQTMPWYADDPQHLLQLKPQSWLNPNAPYQDAQLHNEGFQVNVGVFGGPRIEGQPGDDLIENHGVSIHNGGGHPELISSGNTLNITPLNTDVSQTFFSLTKQGGRAAIVQHVLLNNADGEEFSRNLVASHNLAEVVDHVRNSKLLNRGYATIDPDDIF